MKTIKTIVLCLAMVPATAMAQENIKKAFLDFVNNSAVEVRPSTAQEKDPNTGQKKSQCDMYRFTLSTKRVALLKEIQNAFRLDSEQAYHMGSGVKDQSGAAVALAVGDGDGNGVTLGSEEGMNYMFASFIAPEDIIGNHRYAYGMEWKENGDKISGMLVVTYATTQKYRLSQSLEGQVAPRMLSGLTTSYTVQTSSDGQVIVNGDTIAMGNGANLDSAIMAKIKRMQNSQTVVMKKDGSVQFGNTTVRYPDTWFTQFTSYITGMYSADVEMRRALASKLYSHTKIKGMKVDQGDKFAAKELLKIMMSEKRFSGDPIVFELLRQANMNIKVN